MEVVISHMELQMLWRLAKDRVAAKTTHSLKVAKDQNDVEILFIGSLGEFAMATQFHLEFDTTVLEGGDGHAPDLFYKDGRSIEVKLRQIHKGARYCDLCLSPHETVLKSDVAVLALTRQDPMVLFRGGESVSIELVGEISKADFEATKMLIRFNRTISRTGVKMNDLVRFDNEPLFTCS